MITLMFAVWVLGFCLSLMRGWILGLDGSELAGYLLARMMGLGAVMVLVAMGLDQMGGVS